jgi:hypothetical protein
MRITKPLIITLAVLSAASCGGSAKRAVPVAPAATFVTAAPATASATTIPAPTVPPTTVAQTTTTMSLQDVEKIVRARFLDIDGPQVERCLANPETCDPTAFTAKEAPLRAVYTKLLKDLVEHKWIVREPPNDPSYTVITSVTFDAKRTNATVLSCRWSTNVLLQPAAGPDGSDIIVNDLKNSYDHNSSMVLENGKWMMSDKRDVTKHEGVNACPPRG